MKGIVAIFACEMRTFGRSSGYINQIEKLEGHCKSGGRLRMVSIVSPVHFYGRRAKIAGTLHEMYSEEELQDKNRNN
jgi:hypothetical protein